ncbi:hypothetical protein DFH09DRAFT_1303258 [Mycena vulgaris]|nr:hypothetical protein DFH09DRAFT_1303258 [Mycena vulgaris]
MTAIVILTNAEVHSLEGPSPRLSSAAVVDIGRASQPPAGEALPTGLLGLVVLCAHFKPAHTTASLHHLLVLRSASTVYDSVLSQIAPGIALTETIMASERFRKSPVYKAWCQLRVLTSVRALILQNYALGLKAGDNIECQRIRSRTEFQGCAACQNKYYYSKKCQIWDWREGDHRRTCLALQTFRLRASLDLITVREQGFLRALLHHDYEKQNHSIRIRQVLYMLAHPGSAFFTRFDYTGGEISFGIHPMAESPGPWSWESFALRVTRSAGRMKLHAMVLAGGLEMLFPLRRDQGESGSWGSEVVRALVVGIDDAEVVEIH